jgi:hypothetical protein
MRIFFGRPCFELKGELTVNYTRNILWGYGQGLWVVSVARQVRAVIICST